MLEECANQSMQARIADSDVLLVLGECWSNLAPMLGLDSQQNPASQVVCLHPVFDTRLARADLSSPELLQQRYEIGAELGVVVLLLKALEPHLSSFQGLPEFLRGFLDELDVGHIASESSLAEEELEVIAQILAHAKCASIIVGASFFTHPHAELIAHTLCTIGQLGGIRIIPLDYGSAILPALKSSANSLLEFGLDSSDVAEILGLLATIEEANGAYVYCSLLPQVNLVADSVRMLERDSLPVLFASAGFLRLMKLVPDTQANLCLDPMLESTCTITCRIVQAPYLQGALAVLDMAHLAHKHPELAGRYPFIKAHFAQTDSATQALGQTLGNGGHHG